MSLPFLPNCRSTQTLWLPSALEQNGAARLSTTKCHRWAPYRYDHCLHMLQKVRFGTFPP